MPKKEIFCLNFRISCRHRRGEAFAPGFIGEVRIFIRKCFTLRIAAPSEDNYFSPKLGRSILFDSAQHNQGEAFGYKILGLSHKLSPKCFAPT